LFLYASLCHPMMLSLHAGACYVIWCGGQCSVPTSWTAAGARAGPDGSLDR